MKQNKIFIAENEYLPELYYDMILVESNRPILFTCVDSNNAMYVVTCHVSDVEKCEWIIGKSRPEKIIELLENKRTIRDALISDNVYLYIATLYAGKKNVITKRKKLSEVPDNILPTDGYFMDAEDDEFASEIYDLKIRIKNESFVQFKSDFHFNTTALVMKFEVNNGGLARKTKKQGRCQGFSGEFCQEFKVSAGCYA